MNIYRENTPEWHQEKVAREHRERQKLEDEFVQSQLGPVAQQYKSAKREREIKEREKELRERFAQLLADDMIDLPDDYFDEKLYSEDVNFITGSAEAVFSKLENKNLDRIIETQDTEQQFEENRRDFELFEKEIEDEVATLSSNKVRLEQQLVDQTIMLETLEKESMMNKQEDKKKKKKDEKDDEEEKEPDI